MEVHHKTYKNIFKEKPEDLEILCSKHHKKEHGLLEENKIVKAIKLIRNNGHNFFIRAGLKRLKYKGPISAREGKQRGEILKLKARNKKIAEALELKGSLVRKLNRKGIKEINGKKLYYYDYEFLLTLD